MCDCFHFAVGKEECCCILKGEGNKTSVPSQPFSEICFHDNRM